jgi:hypothetical protein
VWIGANNRAYTPQGGGLGLVLPTAPTFAQQLLQGQTAWAQSTWQSGTSDFQPQSPNYILAGFKQGAAGSNPIASTNVYRSQNGAAFSLYDNITAASSATLYGNYVSAAGTVTGVTLNDSTPAGGWPIQNAVDHCYADNAAGSATGYPQGSGPNFYQGNGYAYQFSHVDSLGNEGPRSASSIIVYFQNGLLITCGGTFNGTLNFQATDGGVCPSGAAQTAKFVSVGGNNLINPFASYSAVRWNLNLRGYNYMNFAIKPGQAGSSLQMLALRVGDHNINSSAGNGNVVQLSNYGTLTNGAYTNFKVPLADIETDFQFGQQTSWYKMDLQSNGGDGTFWIDNWNFSVN